MNFFGLEIPDILLIAGAIFYSGIIYLVWNIIRRKYPVKVLKMDLGQTATFHKAKEDDLKVHWSEGFTGKIQHEAMKLAHCRIIPFWGLFNKVYLARHDWNILIPFMRSTPKVQLCKDCASQFHQKEAIEYLEAYESMPLRKILCPQCKEKIPDWLIVDFLYGDEVKGSSTEAIVQRENEDFTDEASRSLRKRKKADVLTYLALGGLFGSMMTMIIFIAMGIIKLV
jgi:hypothetical protein